MRVLIVHPKVPVYGGAEKVIVRLCEYLRKQGIEHALNMPSVPEQMKMDLAGTKIIPGLCYDYGYWKVVNYHNFPATLKTFVHPLGSECWYCNEPPELFTNWKRKPIEFVNRRMIVNKILNVIVADQFNADRFERLYGIKPRIIPYGIDWEYFSQVDRKPDPEYFTVMQVGTISRYKNQIETIRACSGVIGQIPNLRLWLIGHVSEPDYRQQVEDEIRASGMAGSVFWEPHVRPEQLRYMYSRCDVLMHPVKEQGGWLTPFEAMSAGVPVIVSNELTCSKIINNNQLGLVARDYAKALWLVYTTKNRLDGNRNSLWVRDNLSWDKFGSEMVKYYQEISE
jgi:glycosyltransferase involved in cell wall biosynthesis